MCSEPTIPEGLSSLDQTLERYLGTCSRKEKKSLTKRLSIEVLSDQDSSLALKIITPDDFQGQQNKLKNK